MRWRLDGCNQEDFAETELLEAGGVGGGMILEERNRSAVLEQDELPSMLVQELVELAVECVLFLAKIHDCLRGGGQGVLHGGDLPAMRHARGSQRGVGTINEPSAIESPSR